MFLVLIPVGFLGIPSGNSGLSYASAALMLLFVFIYDLTVVPVCYCLISEMPSTCLRIKSAVFARNCYDVASITANFLNLPIVNPTAWYLTGKGGFIWAAFCGFSFIWSYFRLPEPCGRTPAEPVILFEQKIGVRKFSEVKVNPFRSTNLTLISDATVH